MEIKKNDILTVEITDTGIEGEGIGKTDGFILLSKMRLSATRYR